MIDHSEIVSGGSLFCLCLIISLVLTKCLSIRRESLRLKERAKLRKESDDRFDRYMKRVESEQRSFKRFSDMMDESGRRAVENSIEEDLLCKRIKKHTGK